MKGCLYKIITLLVIAFLGLYLLQYFQNSGFTMDTIQNKSVSFIQSTKVNDEVTNFLESTGVVDEKVVYEPPTEFKPMLNSSLVTFPSQPTSVEDFKGVLLYMANQNLLELTINYRESFKTTFEDNSLITDNVSTAFDEVVVEYVDLFSGISRANYQMEGNIFSSSLTIKLSSPYVNDMSLTTNQVYFEQAAKNINTSLYQSGVLDSSMSQSRIAKELYSYVTKYLAYDESLSKDSYTGYGAVKNRTAVCQGYTALYNYLLKLNNISCYGQSGVITETNTQHIWTIANLDGSKTYIDVTFGDPTPNVENYTDYKYFDVTKEFLSESRSGVE